MYRSFPSVRMTGFRFVVILTEGKDLYESSRDNILLIPQLSVMNQINCQRETCNSNQNREQLDIRHAITSRLM